MTSTEIPSKDLKEPLGEAVEVQPVKERDMWTRVVHSFQRKANDEGHEFALGDADLVREAGDLTRLNRKLSTRHLSMIAIGGSIGCGLFIGSGDALIEFRTRVDGEHGLAVGGAVEQAVDIVGRAQIHAVDRQNVVAYGHLHAGFGQGERNSGTIGRPTAARITCVWRAPNATRMPSSFFRRLTL